MQVFEFSFADKWFDYAHFPLKVIRKYGKRDGSMGKFCNAYNRYFSKVLTGEMKETKQQRQTRELRELRSREADRFVASLPPVISSDIWGKKE